MALRKIQVVQGRQPIWPMGDMIAHGAFAQYDPFSKIGFNGDIDDTEEVIWAVGGTYVFPTVGQRMEVVSASANDDGSPVGTGVRTVTITYLDSDYVEHSEVVTLNGTTPVETVADDIFRVNNLRAESVGALGAAAGNIDIRHLNNTPIYSRIVTGNTRARNSVWTVPADKELYITQLTYGAAAAATGHYCKFTLRANYNDVTEVRNGVFYPHSEIYVQDNTFTITYVVPMKFPEKTDMYVTAIGDGGSANIIASVQYRGYVELEP